MEYKSGLSLTEAERKRDIDTRRRVEAQQYARRKASRQNYQKRGSVRHQRAYARMVGSE